MLTQMQATRSLVNSRLSTKIVVLISCFLYNLMLRVHLAFRTFPTTTGEGEEEGDERIAPFLENYFIFLGLTMRPEKCMCERAHNVAINGVALALNYVINTSFK